MRIEFTIDGPPQGKRRPRTRVIMQHGKPMATIYSDPADKDREAVIRAMAFRAMDLADPFTGPVRVTIEAVFEVAPSWPKKRKAEALANVWHTAKPDGDNVAKSILDGLNPDPKSKEPHFRVPFCLVDDGQVAVQIVRKRYGSPARTEVVVEDVPVRRERNL